MRNLLNRIAGGAMLTAMLTAALPGGAWAEDAPLPGGEVSLGAITVTGTREEAPKAETAATVDALPGEEIRAVKPAHPSEIMNRTPGVWVSQTGGEGHQTAIRQPLTTAPVYLYLEDGIPIRSTGFFNHNALYEVNIPMSGGVEVTKGPGTSLYGSDAIGGVINSLTRPAPAAPEAEANVEGGSFGWARALVTGGSPWGDHGVRGDLNVTHTGGWRDATDYDRQSAGMRWDGFFAGGFSTKTVFNYSNIDQQTAGSSRLSKEDYENNPERNYTPISWRKVEAWRLSMALDRETDDSLTSVTPYVRKNKLGYIANWSLGYDPAILRTDNDSVGLLARHRMDFAPWRTRLIAGVDVDYSPGAQWERRIKPLKEGKIYTSYTEQDVIYDYNAAFTGISPYVHAETSPVESLRLSAGLRYDSVGYAYDNRLSAVAEGSTRRPEDTSVGYTHVSPKVGATYAFGPALNGFISYRHAFRAPSQSQLFRQGKAQNTVDLKPVKADSYEVGLRGAGAVTWEVSVYQMNVTDDILSFTHPDKSTETVNAGRTSHKGVQAGASAAVTPWLDARLSLSYAEHRYEEWKPQATVDYSGKEISSAPRLLGNATLGFHPGFLGGATAELEWTKVGGYWMDDANTHQYAGHDVFNARVAYRAGALDLYARAMNLANTRWANAAAYSAFGGEEFAPGAPLSLYAGLTYYLK
ncbi:MAG: TonB-dependent receptor [Nitrospinae bacterium]|nr:TonB-dependent receptor [Nitrospinota bacterium]